MSYEVTATRRRPQVFDGLVGQEFVAETLKNTIDSKKIAHAYLFSGPRGCGKTSTSRIFAKALNCANGPTSTPCGVCPHCLEITQGTSPDVIEIDGASNTSVNDVRQIKEEVLFAPQSAKYKVYIIDEVHMLSNAAFNALLKTIEEPPEYVVFIFATTELQKVPATIKSRCQQFNFRLVPIDTVEKLLEDAAKEIGIQADEEALYWVARESTGSVRDAYTLFDQVVAFSGDHLTYEKIRDKLGLVGVDRLNVIFEDCVQRRANDAILKLDEFMSQGVSIEQFISNSTDYLRSLLLIKNGITKESLLGQSADRFSVNVLNAWNSIQIERAISLFLQLYRDIRYSISPRYELELSISRLSWLTQYVSPMEVKRAIDQTKNLLLSTQTSAPLQNVINQNVNINSNQRNQSKLESLMNPTTWQQNANPSVQTRVPQTLKPKEPLPVLDALKNLPEYQNSPSISSSMKSNENQQNLNQTLNQSLNQQSFSQIPSFNSLKQEPSEPEQEIPLIEQGSVEITPSRSFEKVDEANLKQFIINEIEVRNGVLAASFLETQNWKKSNNSITFEVSTDFQKTNFERKRLEVLNELEKIFGQKINFEIILHKVEVVDTKASAPESVKILLSTFRGEIVGVGEKTANNPQSMGENPIVNPETQTQSENQNKTDNNEDSDETDGIEEQEQTEDFDFDDDDE